jgi:hypothetical protein
MHAHAPAPNLGQVALHRGHLILRDLGQDVREALQVILRHPQRKTAPVQQRAKHRVHVVGDEDWDATVQDGVLGARRPAITCGPRKGAVNQQTDGRTDRGRWMSSAR